MRAFASTRPSSSVNTDETRAAAARRGTASRLNVAERGCDGSTVGAIAAPHLAPACACASAEPSCSSTRTDATSVRPSNEPFSIAPRHATSPTCRPSSETSRDPRASRAVPRAPSSAGTAAHLSVVERREALQWEIRESRADGACPGHGAASREAVENVARLHVERGVAFEHRLFAGGRHELGRSVRAVVMARESRDREEGRAAAGRRGRGSVSRARRSWGSRPRRST